jgi:hypothetical protein
MSLPAATNSRIYTYTCDPDFDVAQLGVVTHWTPVTNLTFSAEVMWFHLNQKFSGFATLTPTAPKPTAITSSSTTIPSPSRFAFSLTSDRYLPAAINV